MHQKLKNHLIEWRDLSSLLNHHPVRVSAPARLDCGGTWDIRALALVKESFCPQTVNLAIDLRTEVQLKAYQAGKLYVKVAGVGEEEVVADAMSFEGPLGLLYAIASFFGVSGVAICVHSQIPVRRGLGGSGSLAVALIAAFAELLKEQLSFSRARIAWLAHALEDSMGFSMTGLQDQLAAVYGGLHCWTWQYSHGERPFTRQQLLPESAYPELESRILIIDTEEARDSTQATERYVQSFLREAGQVTWHQIQDAVHDFAQALQHRNWQAAAQALARETLLREKILTTPVSDFSRRLKESALACGCGAAFAGGNRGGCFWALGERNAIEHLRQEWDDILKDEKQGLWLPFRIASQGLMVERTE